MRQLSISKRADPAYVEAFGSLVKKLSTTAKATSKEPIAMYLAGGAAMHFYTGARMSDDVDAVFNRKLFLPSDAVVIYRDAKGTARSLYFDTNYNETFGLLHEDAHDDAMRLSLSEVAGVDVFVLQPIDLAVSKLARFSEIDREDIRQLARDGLITASELRQRAEAALHGYVGDSSPLRTYIELACADIEALQRSDHTGNA
jgi:transcriptional regulator of met regulon